MSYTRTTWENGSTPLNATNMNNIEDGIEEALVIKHGHKHIAIPANNISDPTTVDVGTVKYYSLITDNSIIEQLLTLAQFLASKTLRNITCKVFIGNSSITGTKYLTPCSFDDVKTGNNYYYFKSSTISYDIENGFVQWQLDTSGNIFMNVEQYLTYIKQLGMTLDFYYDYEEPVTE